MEGLADEYKRLFADEALDHLSRLEDIFIALEKQNEANPELLMEAMRLLHTIKGSAGMVGAHEISDFSHKLEDVLADVKEGKASITSSLIDLLLKAVDELRQAVKGFVESGEIRLDFTIIDEIRGLNGELARRYGLDEERLASLVGEDGKVYEIYVRLKEDCPIKKIRAFMTLKSLSDLGEVIATSPASFSTEVRELSVLLTSQASETEIDQALMELPDIDEFRIREIRLSRHSRGRITQEKKSIVSGEIEKLLQKVESEIEKKRGASIKGSDASFSYKVEEIKVSVEDLDKLLNLVSELLLFKSRLGRIARDYGIRELREEVSKLGRLVLDINELTMRMRLIPLDQIFSLLPRMVRDLARKSGKEVDLIIEGREIRVDRRILEEILDPLIHLIRNAVDHGIEPPEERRKLGKIEKGTIRVSARKEGNYIVIEVEDDGRGIDLEKVKKVAIEKGILSENIAERLSERELLNVIFTPGFSTKDETTLISGRGIGMSTVKNRVEMLGGFVRIQSKRGVGTRVTLYLPMQVATLNAIIAEVEGNLFAIPISNIDRVMRARESSILRIKDLNLMEVDEELIPLINLPGCKLTPDDSYVMIISSTHKEKRIGVLVSSVMEQENVVVKPLSFLLKDLKWLSGITILGDGSLCFIVDVDSLIEEVLEDEGRYA